MAIADYRDIVMIAGNDPYAYKGTEDIAQAYIRPDGQGGCENGVVKRPIEEVKDMEAHTH